MNTLDALTRRARRHPLASVALGLAAIWILGPSRTFRIVRGLGVLGMGSVLVKELGDRDRSSS